MRSDLFLAALACLSLAAAAGARRPHARSDSGRSLLPRSQQDDGELVGEGVEDAADWRPRGMGPGLTPWPLQARLAAEEERRRLEAPLLQCRSRFVHALRAAGPAAERKADAAVEAARDLLEDVVEGATADVPDELEDDPELAALQASLRYGQRYPASDILESRWRRLVRVSRTAPDDAVVQAGQRVRDSAVPLWRAVKQALQEDAGDEADRLGPEAGATLNKFRKCLQHRLLPRGVVDGADPRDGGRPAEAA